MNPIRFKIVDLFTPFVRLALLLIALGAGKAPSQAAELPNVVAGAIAVPGERDTYTFTVENESRFYFDSLTNIGSLTSTLRGPAGVVAANRSFSSSDSQSIGDPTIF